MSAEYKSWDRGFHFICQMVKVDRSSPKVYLLCKCKTLGQCPSAAPIPTRDRSTRDHTSQLQTLGPAWKADLARLFALSKRLPGQSPSDCAGVFHSVQPPPTCSPRAPRLPRRPPEKRKAPQKPPLARLSPGPNKPAAAPRWPFLAA